MIYYFVIFLFSLFLTVIVCLFFIPFLRKINVKQPIYEYVENHKEKQGTPTMGGLLFIIPACITSIFQLRSSNNLLLFILSIGLSFLAVGFIDDFLKIKLNHNEGLKPYQKIIFQFSIAILCGIYAYKNNLDYFFVPFSKNIIKLGIFSIPIVVFVFLAITNSVNLTDGIDGLASTVSIIYLIFLDIIIFLEKNILEEKNLFLNENSFYIVSFSLLGGLCGFLFFNINKAKIFMGDTGSLSLGGLLGALSVFSLNGFYIPFLGIMFVFSSISVIVQVIHYKRTKKRLFLMAPFHHHLQAKGFSEAKICYFYLIITFLICFFVILFLL